MTIICIDDEKLVLDLTVSLCRELPVNPEVKGFQRAADVLSWLRDNTADIALTDINMPDMNGLVLAAKLKKQCPDMKIIFLTGYSEYAVDAFKLHASGYIMKPVGKERLLSEIEYAMSDEKQAKVPAHIEAHTFGEFDLIIDGEPAALTRAKAKELLAYLIDRHGHSVSRANVFAVLFEDKQYDRSMQKQLDVIIRSLRDTLRKYGSEDIFELSRGTLRIRPEMIDCDMYRFMNGDIEAINSYRGEYMNSYSWAAITEAFIAQERYDEK